MGLQNLLVKAVMQGMRHVRVPFLKKLFVNCDKKNLRSVHRWQH